MKKNILLIGGSSNIAKKIIQNLNLKKFDIYTTSNSKKIINQKVKNFKENLKNFEEIQNLINIFEKKKIKFDYVIFLQGIIYSIDLSNYDEKKILDVFTVNTLSVISFSKEIVKVLKKNSLNVYVNQVIMVVMIQFMLFYMYLPNHSQNGWPQNIDLSACVPVQ